MSMTRDARMMRVRSMIRFRTALLTLIVVDVVLALAAARMPRFPGDPQLALAIQRFAPMPIPLAQAITTSALMPWCFVLLAATIALAWIISGWARRRSRCSDLLRSLASRNLAKSYVCTAAPEA